MGVIRVLDPSGHQEVEFDVAKPETVDLASQLFAEAIDRGMAVVDRTHGDGEVVSEFDPKTQKDLVAVPQISGG